jgi:hypothetical protein
MAILNDDNGNLQELNPFSFLVAESSDKLHFGQMLRDPDRPKLEVAMKDEINGLCRHETLKIVPASSMPPKTKP